MNVDWSPLSNRAGEVLDPAEDTVVYRVDEYDGGLDKWFLVGHYLTRADADDAAARTGPDKPGDAVSVTCHALG